MELRRVGEPGARRARSTPRSAASRWSAPRALSGSRFGYIVGDTALLALALYRFALDRAVAHGHMPMLPPVLVREEAMYGTGFFPTERSNIYALEGDDLYLTGTSEVALAGFHMGEILEELPLRYAAFSTCFRRESGAAGKDTRGMFRVHQFNKVELFVYCEPERSRRGARPAARDRGGARRRRSACRTASSTSPPATSARRRRRSTTSRRGSRRSSATARSRRPRTRPTSRRAGSGSATAPGREAARDAAHAERHGGHRPLAARDPRELRRRGARRAAGVRRARRRSTR